jgi:virulence-associated protein VapD
MQLNAITQVLPTPGPVNDILYTLGSVYISTNTKDILKFSSDGKLKTSFKSSSNCVFNIKCFKLQNKDVNFI